MSQSATTESGRLTDLFAAHAEDWTPASASGTTRILHMPLLFGAGVLGDCRSILSDAELERSIRFNRAEDQNHFLQRRAFRRFCTNAALGSALPLSEFDFHETDKGRPYLPQRQDIWFSFSSFSRGFLGSWSSTHAVGVDLEDTEREVEAAELAARFFTPAEARVVTNAVAPPRSFLQLWSLKEAALKSIGEGLPYGLDAFEFELAPSLRLVKGPAEYGGAEVFAPHLIHRANTCAAAVIRNRGD